MADAATTSSVKQTAAVALPTTAGLVFIKWLVAPVWPPPDDVIIMFLGVMAPVFHLIGAEIMQRLTRWSEADEPKVLPAPVAPVPPKELAPMPTGQPA